MITKVNNAACMPHISIIMTDSIFFLLNTAITRESNKMKNGKNVFNEKNTLLDILIGPPLPYAPLTQSIS